MKATKQLKCAIDKHTTYGSNELEAISKLHALLTGTQPDPPLPKPQILLPIPEPNGKVELLIEEPPPQPTQTFNKATPPPNLQGPTTITVNDDELNNTTAIGADDIPPSHCYNLHPQPCRIIQSTLDDVSVIPKDHIAFTIINKETDKALQYCDLIKLDMYKDIWA